ncbi:helix-turn-helix domain-containing protein [Cohnella hashimotonis]|uniref:AraC family transcriptional regulator n=1 Tax=Cohnella hashimotonis TaxID=2826895 RepID=A0ABT6TP80_9BACL|nr:AraC family transcriptional regulator [Cohnella hashimotonis]MDI4647637.1 AraC family transcriptional regulator [Cohnella hashimotonis]
MPASYVNVSPAWSADSVRLIATPSELAKSAFYFVQEVGHFYANASYFTEREGIDSYLIVYTVSGSGRLAYRNQSYALTSGQAFFIDCMDYQHYSTIGDGTWELLWIHLNGSQTRRYYEAFSGYASAPVITAGSDSIIPGRIRELIDLHRFHFAHTELLSARLLTDVLTELVVLASGSGQSPRDVPAYVRQTVQAIDSRYRERLTLETLANERSVSKFNLSRAFKRYIGLGPIEYLIQVRMNHAKEYLKYADVPVGEIAERVGIDNASHFINLFKERTGLTPLAYRKQWKSRR